MTQSELKHEIEINTLSDELLIMVCAGVKDKATKTIHYGAHFLADQYILEIAKNKGLECQRVESLKDAQATSLDFLLGATTYLKILRVGTFDELDADYSQYENTIVVCDKIDKKILAKVDPYVVYIPEPEQWATEAFLDYYCPGVSPSMLSWLYTATSGNLYRLCNELDKVKLFNEADRTSVLVALRDAANSDLYSTDVFQLIEAIFMHDIAKIREIRDHLDSFDTDPVGLTTLLLRKYKGILLAVCTPMSAAELGMSDKQLNFFRSRYSWLASNTNLQKQYQDKITFLTNVDLRLKQCRMEMPTELFIDYIISHMLA